MKGARKRSPDRGCGIEAGAQMVGKTSTKGKRCCTAQTQLEALNLASERGRTVCPGVSFKRASHFS